MKDLVAFDCTAIVPGINPAHAVHRQRPARQLLACPTATGAADTGKHYQRNTWQSQQLLVNIQVGQFQFLHYTAATAVNRTALESVYMGRFYLTLMMSLSS